MIQSDKKIDGGNSPGILLNDLFVGRVSQLRALKLGLTHATAGKGRLFMIEGEAGIGLTRALRPSGNDEYC